MKIMEVNDSLDLNKIRLEDESKLNSLLSSEEFRKKALTIEDHYKFMDEHDNNSDSYPGAEIDVNNLHLALSVVRRLYKEVGALDNKDADAAFYHETAHFSEAINHGVDPNNSKIKVFLLRADESSTINSIEVRIRLPLPDKLSEQEKSKAIALIALAPGDLSPGDKKLAGL